MLFRSASATAGRHGTPVEKGDWGKGKGKGKGEGGKGYGISEWGKGGSKGDPRGGKSGGKGGKRDIKGRVGRVGKWDIRRGSVRGKG